MGKAIMTHDIGQQVAALRQLTAAQLRDRYAELFGEPPLDWLGQAAGDDNAGLGHESFGPEVARARIIAVAPSGSQSFAGDASAA